MRRLALGLAPLLLAAVPLAAHAQSPCPNGECGPVEHVSAASCDDSGSLIARLRARCQSGECVPRMYGNPDLFYNFWVAPTCGGVGAQLYLAPHPIPANVGHTFITYQPLMPHEWLYPHSRTYHRYYDEGRGINRTRVNWTKSPQYRAANLMEYFRVAR